MKTTLKVAAVLGVLLLALYLTGVIIDASRPGPCDNGRCDALTCQSVTGDVVIRLGECPSGYVPVSRETP